ncbi:MAG: hypothetical protein RQ731_06215 [Anaerosomatales bacterium]|nr:hypothetical protein [Anaerosomatales bacterium]MDT8434333.1 hypothetical protein [Anaerosomatales bacterium]
MDPQTEHTAPRVLDTYGLTYAFTALFLVPALFIIDRLSIDAFTPGYLALTVIPFLLGPAAVFAIDSRDGARTVAIRSAVLAPLVAVTGVGIVFIAMMLLLPPLSLVLAPENFGGISVLFVALVVLLALPMLVSVTSRVREGFSVAGAVQVGVLTAVLALVVWVVVMTFDSGTTLGTLMRKDTVEHFIGTFTWYLPSLGIAAGVWRATGLV